MEKYDVSTVVAFVDGKIVIYAIDENSEVRIHMNLTIESAKNLIDDLWYFVEKAERCSCEGSSQHIMGKVEEE